MSVVVENSTILSALTERFNHVFGGTADLEYFFSPGRINLIGEHTDYNGGYVFPASITIGTTGLARLRADQKIKLFSVVLDDLFKLNVPRLELVQLGQKTENDFIGVNSGILDQFAIGFGEVKKAILLDCNTLKYEMVPVELRDYDIVIMNTNKPRALTESKYNERFAETREALKRMQTKLNIQSLGELSNEEFDANTALIGDETLIKRARHAVYENNRTKVAQKAFVAGNLTKFGELLNASHASLKNDYEVTGLELDTLAETAQKQPGVLGARMTGAGFGGCAIALVAHDNVPSFEKAVGETYEKVVGYPASFYVAQIGSGSTKLDVE